MKAVIHHGVLMLEDGQSKSVDFPPNLMFEVEQAGNRIVSKTVQLISNNTTNLSECYMSIQAKMDGGNKSIAYNLGHLNIVAR